MRLNAYFLCFLHFFAAAARLCFFLHFFLTAGNTGVGVAGAAALREVAPLLPSWVVSRPENAVSPCSPATPGV